MGGLDAYPGVSIGDGVVVTARSSVFSDLVAWVVARGAPAVPVGVREFDIKETITRS